VLCLKGIWRKKKTHHKKTDIIFNYPKSSKIALKIAEILIYIKIDIYTLRGYIQILALYIRWKYTYTTIHTREIPILEMFCLLSGGL